ncbi:MAG: pyridoxal-dependent decarboxylase [Thermoanaerobaculia bacterium]
MSDPLDRPQPNPALDPSPEEIRSAGAAVVDWMASYSASLRGRDLYPDTTSKDLAGLLAGPLPQEGRSIVDLLATLDEVVVAGSRHNGHPRFFGYVSAPGTAVASFADLLASTLNSNLTAWRSAPAPVELEHRAIDWIREALGCDVGAGGLFTSGGSLANFTAIAAARHRHDRTINSTGMRGAARPLRLYISTEGHHSSDKAAALLGIGLDNVCRIAVDAEFRMRVEVLERQIAADRAAGFDPFCIVASAGTVVTGAIDPLQAIADVAARENLWLHVDGCYGGFARLAPSVRERFSGIERADSVALDPHKWLYLPADCGCLIYRRPQELGAAFALGADYTRVTAANPDEAFAFWDYGPELTRRFRALKVWMTLAHVGARAMGEAIESNIDCAHHFARLIAAGPDFEMLAPVELSIFCFRHRGSRGAITPGELDRWNERLLAALQKDASSYLSNASIHGQFALRGCVLNYRTTRQDMEILLADLRRVASTLDDEI